MSTVALMLHPSWDIGELVGAFKPAFGSLKRSIFVREGVTVRWDEVGMDRLVGQVEHPRFVPFPIFDPFPCKTVKNIGDVSLLRNAFSIDVETIAIDLWDIATFDFGFVRIAKVDALPLEADPMIKAWLHVVDHSAHVPLADKGRFISSILQILGKVPKPFWNRVVVVDHSMIVGIESCQNGRSAR